MLLCAAAASYELVGFDPMAVDYGRTSDLRVSCRRSLQRTLDDADTAVITVPWEEINAPSPH
jgi:UDP-glucose 6-dehydrogenase